MCSRDITYVASGFYEDCLELLQKFESTECITFKSFCSVWQDMKFSLVFLYKKTFSEMLEFCEEALKIAKLFVLPPNTFLAQICGLFLLYALYYKMPIDNVKIRVTLCEWKQLLEFHSQLKEKGHYDASYIFVKLVYDKAFLHCLFANEYGIEKHKVRNEVPTENPYSVLDNILDEFGNGGTIANFQKMSQLYKDCKLKLSEDSAIKNLKIFEETDMDSWEQKLIELKSKRQEEIKKRTKEKANSNVDDKYHKYTYENKIRAKVGHAFDTDSSADDESDLENLDKTASDNKGLSMLEDDDEEDDAENEAA